MIVTAHIEGKYFSAFACVCIYIHKHDNFKPIYLSVHTGWANKPDYFGQFVTRMCDDAER